MGIRIPDLCGWYKDGYIVCDVSIVSDMAKLDEEHGRKVRKYDIRDIHQWMKDNSPLNEEPSPTGVITAFICNWRGVLAQKTADFWRKIISRNHLMSFTTSVLIDTYNTWRTFNATTSRNKWRKIIY